MLKSSSQAAMIVSVGQDEVTVKTASSTNEPSELPRGPKAIFVTAFVCPLRVRSNFPVSASQTFKSGGTDACWRYEKRNVSQATLKEPILP